MTATWTTPKTWATGELVTADKLNEQLRDNLLAIKEPPSAEYEAMSTYSTTSTTFVDVDATNFALTLTTNGGDVLVSFFGAVVNSTYPVVTTVDVLLSTTGSRLGNVANGLCTISTTIANNHLGLIGFNKLVTGLAAGTHTFKLQWKCGGATSSLTLPSRFWAREVS